MRYYSQAMIAHQTTVRDFCRFSSYLARCSLNNVLLHFINCASFFSCTISALYSNYPLLLTNALALLVNKILVWLRIRFNCNSMRYSFNEIQLRSLMNNLENAGVSQGLSRFNRMCGMPQTNVYAFVCIAQFFDQRKSTDTETARVHVQISR